MYPQNPHVRDGADDSQQQADVDALVASGDGFITLATQLDAHPAEVEEVIRVLLYLQRHYSIVKKQPNFRQ